MSVQLENVAPGRFPHGLPAVAQVGVGQAPVPPLPPLLPAPVPPLGALKHAAALLASKHTGAFGAKQHDAVYPFGPSVQPVIVAPG